MKSVFAGVFGLFIFCAANAEAAVSYATIADTNAIVTGIRSTSSTTDAVVITANYSTGGVMYAGLYEGSLAGAETAPSTSWNALTPVFSGQTVTAATFYGPNTPFFNPSIGAGNVVAVGSYKYAEGSPSAAVDHGLLYQGPITGIGGTWTQIDATLLVQGGDSLKNTIAHSTMGNLVVGNYDTNLAVGKAFIYNKVADSWKSLNPGGTQSVTAYGIWQNGGSTSTSYTIAGGQGNLGPGVLDKSYLVDYDSATGALTHYRTFAYNNLPSSAPLCHFDGITATATGFNLTGIVTTGGTLRGFFASVPRKSDGSFGEATWTPIFYQGSTVTTGNTVVGNNVLGIFLNGGTQSYIATVQPDQSVAVSVAKSGTKATFTITNTGDTAGSYGLSRVSKVENSYFGPGPVKIGEPLVKITYSLAGANVTSALSAGTATTGSLAAGESVKLVEKVKALRKVLNKRTIKTTIQATSADGSKSDSAKAKLVLKVD